MTHNLDDPLLTDDEIRAILRTPDMRETIRENRRLVRKAAPVAGTRMTGQIDKGAGFASGLGPRQIRVLASTPVVDFANEIVAKDALLNDPADVPIFYNHASSDPDTLPIGRGIFRRTARGIEGIITFAPEGDDPMADRVCRACKNELLDSCSIGFQPKTTKRSKDGKHLIYEKILLLEVSIVGIGCCPEARVTQRALNGSNPERESRVQRAREIRELGERKARAHDIIQRGHAIRRAVEQAEAPHPTDHMSAPERRAYARAVIARGNPTQPTRIPTTRREQEDFASKHAIRVLAIQSDLRPSRQERMARAARLARGPMEPGR